jgi:hypothetical protein
MKVRFQKQTYNLILTDHAKMQMELRNLTLDDVKKIVEKGKLKQKSTVNKFWVYYKFKDRHDNLVSLSISIENPHLIVITTLVNWRPL